jgi:DNA-binding XRE family transcriptional regulator
MALYARASAPYACPTHPRRLQLHGKVAGIFRSQRVELDTFILELDRARLHMGLSQEGLAFRVGFHFTYISSVERGERNVGLLTVLRLARGLQIQPSELLGRLDSPRTPSGRSFHSARPRRKSLSTTKPER